jgi:hypothetical protein
VSLAVSDGELWMVSTANSRRGLLWKLSLRSENQRGVSSDFGFISAGGTPARGADWVRQECFCEFIEDEKRIFALDIARWRWFAEGAKKLAGGTPRSEAVKNLATDEPGIRWCRNSGHDSMMWR